MCDSTYVRNLETEKIGDCLELDGRVGYLFT
jgi:hypothetical protein